MKKILIEKVFQRGFVVCAQGEEFETFSSGETLDEAIGNMIIGHAESFGFLVTLQDFGFDRPHGKVIVISQRENNVFRAYDHDRAGKMSARETIPLCVGDLLRVHADHFGMEFIWSEDELTKAYLEEFPQMKDVTKINLQD